MELLKQARTLNREIDRLLERRARLWSRATKQTPGYSSDPPGSSGEDKLQCAVEQICALDAEINAAIDRLVSIKAEITNGMEKEQAQVIIWRDIEGRSWGYIAQQLGKSRMAVRCVHKKFTQDIVD